MKRPGCSFWEAVAFLTGWKTTLLPQRHQQPPAVPLKPRLELVAVAAPIHHEEGLERLPAICDEILVAESKIRIR